MSGRQEVTRPPLPDAGVRAAFLGTTYGSRTDRFRLVTDLPAIGPARPGERWGGPCGAGRRWAVLTAWNPGGQLQDAERNAAAQARLLAALHGRLAAPGVNGEGRWREESVIVDGITLRDAADLGARFGQLAVMYGVGRRAALVWCGVPGGNGMRVERRWLARVPTGGAGWPILPPDD